MKRRQALHLGASTALVGVAGCLADSGSGMFADDDASTGESNGAKTTTPRDRLQLVEVDAATAEADGAVVVRFETLSAKAQEAVEAAVENDGVLTYSTGSYRDTTGVDVLYEDIEKRWEETGESFERTYLDYDGTFYGMLLVRDGDWIAVDSTP